MQYEEDINRKINSALRRGHGVTVGPSTPEASRKFNDYVRRAAALGTFEADAETGKITHRDGRPVEQGK